MYNIIVKNVLRLGTRDNYLAAMRLNATASVRDEPRGQRFDVFEAREEFTTIYLYVVFDGIGTLTAHKETAPDQHSGKILVKYVSKLSVMRADVLQRTPQIYNALERSCLKTQLNDPKEC